MRPGVVIGERYRIEAEAGRGAMAQVYRAIDIGTDTPVAVKVLSRADGDEATRFEREIVLLAELRHPGIVALLDRGTLPDGLPYVVLEWLQGEDLAARLERAPLTLGESLQVVAAAAEALAVAHVRGVVHRDVKPANIVLQDGDPARVKVIDFGVARDNRDFR